MESARCSIDRGSGCLPYAGTALGLLKAEGHVGAILLSPYDEGICGGLAAGLCLGSAWLAHTLLFLIAIILRDARFEELSRLVVLGQDYNPCFLLLSSDAS